MYFIWEIIKEAQWWVRKHNAQKEKKANNMLISSHDSKLSPAWDSESLVAHISE